MNETIALTNWDLVLAGGLVLGTGGVAWVLRLGIAKRFLVAALRTVVQLSAIGFVLRQLLLEVRPDWLLLAAVVMLAAASREVHARQRYPFRGHWGIGMGSVAMFSSTYIVTFVALSLLIQPSPWYAPRYSIPLLGMMLGNTMTGVALGLDRLTRLARSDRAAIEARLSLGWPAVAAIRSARIEALRTGLVPIINSMAAAGLVSLPGMMTGQILAGNDPADAVAYQILIMFMIASGTGLGVLASVWMGGIRLFDPRHRLRLDRLSADSES